MLTDREKLLEVSRLVEEQFALRGQQAATQAELIRWCVKALRREPNRHYSLARDQQERAKVSRNKDLALVYLEWLATKLENQSVR